jgi:hypothetical protein
MPALIIGETERARIAELRAVAAANPFDARAAQATADRDMAAFRDWMKTLSVDLPVGYTVVYSHEIQPNAPPPGICHHISISVERAAKLPSPEAVEMILEEFGMKPLKDAHGVWVEDISPGEKAVNVLQLIEPGRTDAHPP